LVFRAGNMGAKRNTAYGVRVDQGAAPLHRKPRMPQVPQSPIFGQVSQVSQFRHNTPGGSKSYGNNDNAQMHRAWDDEYGTGNGRVQNKSPGMLEGRKMGFTQRRPFNNKFTPNHNRDYCSLCGRRDHKAVDGCPNMKSDSGAIIPVLPCKDTCEACPQFIKPRLSHPAYLCPYRKAGPWGL